MHQDSVIMKNQSLEKTLVRPVSPMLGRSSPFHGTDHPPGKVLLSMQKHFSWDHPHSLWKGTRAVCVAAITQQLVQQYQCCVQMDVFFPVCFQGACVMVLPVSVTCCQFWILYLSGESAEEVALG